MIGLLGALMIALVIVIQKFIRRTFMKNKLNGRDFITIGIFNAIGIVIYMAVAFAMATTVIGGFIASGVSFMIAATVIFLWL